MNAPNSNDVDTGNNTVVKLATSTIENERSDRAKKVDRFSEELAAAVVNGGELGTQTALFLLRMEIVPLSIWDETPPVIPSQLSEAIIDTVEGVHPCVNCSLLGTGNFAGYVTGLTDGSGAETITRQVLEAIPSPVEVDGVLFHMTARMAVAMADRSEKSEGWTLENARAALAMTSESNPFLMYSPTMRRRREHDEKLDYDLKVALSAGDLDVVYQPIVSLLESRICGVEAFARWTHPEEGEVLPAQFLTIAERSGTIFELGKQILVKAMKTADSWSQKEEFANVILWVNFSPMEVAHPDFEPMVHNLIQQYPRVQLGLELAESSVIEERIISSTLKRLRAFGVRTSVDDFSSKDTAVSRLRTLPFDNVKVGRGLLRRLATNQDDRAVVELLTELGSRSDFAVSAAGVENQEDLSLLEELGVDAVQGYFLARPATGSEIEALLEATASIETLN